jgi:putative SOS response-associated peptidase YedK
MAQNGKTEATFAIAMKDGCPFTFAGLWENWKDPESRAILGRIEHENHAATIPSKMNCPNRVN